MLYDINKFLKGLKWEGLGCAVLSQDIDSRQDIVYTLMDLRIT
jgi:hypothetical protein